MKRIRRDPVRFDVFAAFAHFSQQHGLPIHDSNAVPKFLDAVRNAAENSLDNDAFVYGFRVQAMFETMVASLGRVKLIKQEDAGSAYYSSDADLILPDFRMVVDDAQLLVEVKNFNQTTGTEPFVQKVAYLEKLKAYAALTKSELLIAVYWLRWNLWTLVAPDVFTTSGDEASLGLGDALLASQMTRLGDKMIATRWPLRFRIELDETARDGAVRTVVIREVGLHSEDKRVLDPVEIRLALFLMFNGDWIEETICEEPDAKLSAVEYQFAPREESRKQDEQGFDMVGWLSSMISRFFRSATVKDGKLLGLHIDFTPGEFGQVVPADYFERDHVLPIWCFEVQRAAPTGSKSEEV